MAYTKQQLLLDIHDLVERYIEQELAARLPQDIVPDEANEIAVVSDSEGDDIDENTGDIWVLETQTIVGRKNLQTKEKEWFNGYVPPRNRSADKGKEEEAPPTTIEEATQPIAELKEAKPIPELKEAVAEALESKQAVAEASEADPVQHTTAAEPKTQPPPGPIANSKPKTTKKTGSKKAPAKK